MDQSRWEIDQEQLADVTPQEARQLLVECFVAAQGETLARNSDVAQAQQPDTMDVRSMAEGTIKLAFANLGYDYEEPAPIALWTVMDYLAGQSKSWGTPPDIIMHHFKEMSKVVQSIRV